MPARSGAVLAVALLLGADAAAWVPPAGKLLWQVARANREAGRPEALVLSVALRTGDGRTLGHGELLSDARGLARLELSTEGGGVERHLLRGGEHRAARGGSPLSLPSPWLPPIFALQGGSADRVRAALLALGGSSDEVVLGLHGERVCWVLGGRDLPPPANASAAAVGSSGARGALWIERKGFRILRIDLADGTRFVLGPPRSFERVELPEWIRIERPGVPEARLEILGARPGRFDPTVAFATDWLQGR